MNTNCPRHAGAVAGRSPKWLSSDRSRQARIVDAWRLLNPVMGLLAGRKAVCRGYPAYREKVRQTVFDAGGGQTYDVTEPELIDTATALPMLSPKRRRTYERLGIAQYLKATLA